MTDEVKRTVGVLRYCEESGARCGGCPSGTDENGVPNCHSQAHIADLIESLSAELEQVKQERDELSAMLTNATSVVHAFKRKLAEAGHKITISPLVQGRMNGRHDGYNVLFSAIDDMPEKPCGSCVNRDWDMPQCRTCNSTNDFRWYAKGD